MALITRCPVCGTLFKVVPDQLRISEGWVRCGQCAEVFDASNDLQQSDLESHTVVAVAATSIEPATATPEADASPLQSPPGFVDTLALPQQGPESLPTEVLENTLVFGAATTPASDLIEVADDERVSPDEPTVNPEYSFARASKAPRPFLRWIWLGVAALLLVMLGLQGVFHHRDYLAARWPELRPALQAVCVRWGCRVGALRQIESIVIESSTLAAIQNGDAYRLGLTLKNQSPLDLAMPSLECIFTDVDEQTVFRRALSPAELGAATRVLFAGREWTVTVDIRVTDPVGRGRILGYRLLAFYP